MLRLSSLTLYIYSYVLLACLLVLPSLLTYLHKRDASALALARARTCTVSTSNRLP